MAFLGQRTSYTSTKYGLVQGMSTEGTAVCLDQIIKKAGNAMYEQMEKSDNKYVAIDIEDPEMMSLDSEDIDTIRLANAISAKWVRVIAKGEEDLEKAKAKMYLYDGAREVLRAAMRFLIIMHLE
jgi:hypothetical protein